MLRRDWAPGRRHLGLALAAALLASAPAAADQLGPLTQISRGTPFAGCTADGAAQQSGTYYPETEIEPWVDADPSNPDRLIAVWQQDRWSNGGARGLAGAYSADRGRTWTGVVPPGVSKCSGGSFTRASDPWVSFGPSGTAYFMSLAFDEDTASGFGRNAMLVNRSTDGGRTWGPAQTLVLDTDPQVLNDKNSLTADPTNPSYAYAVWDRLQDFTLGPNLRKGGNRGAKARALFLRDASARASARAEAKSTVIFKGPIYLARTTNGGQSWEPAKLIYDPGNDSQTIGNQIVVTPAGVVVNFFTEILSDGRIRLALLRSYDKGATFERTPRVVSNMSYSDTGTITPNTQQPVRDAAILFDVAVDPTRGTLYAVWQDTRFRGVDEVAFAQSTDGGTTWSTPVRINKTPSSSNRLRRQAFLPSVVVGSGGALVVTYYDFRKDKSSGELADHWAIVCRANCTRASGWGSERRLTRSSFNYLLAPVAGGLFLGDYMGLAMAGDTVVPVFGTASAGNLTALFTRTLRLTSSRVASR